MVKNKKMSKSAVAIIILSLLLVLSMVLGLTGAWFTDHKNANNSSSKLNFGEITISLDAASFAHSTREGTALLMPGDTIEIQSAVTNLKDEAFMRYKMSVTIELQEGKYLETGSGKELEALKTAFTTAGYSYDSENSVESGEASGHGVYIFKYALAAGAKVPLASGRGESPSGNTANVGFNVTIPVTVSDVAENGTVEIVLDVYAVQQANYAETAWAAAGLAD